jgi:hypothetical protein
MVGSSRLCDHKPLSWIMSVKDLSFRLLTWRIQLEEYDYEVMHKPGAQNSNSDVLSKIDTLKSEANASEEIVEVTKGKILHENYDLILGGHCGMNKTYEAIKMLLLAKYEGRHRRVYEEVY